MPGTTNWGATLMKKPWPDDDLDLELELQLMEIAQDSAFADPAEEAYVGIPLGADGEPVDDLSGLTIEDLEDEFDLVWETSPYRSLTRH